MIRTARITEHYPYHKRKGKKIFMPVTYWHFFDFDKKRPKSEFICLN